MALTAGVTGFGTMLHATAETLTGGLEGALEHRIDLLRHDIDAERAKARIMASDAMIVGALRNPSNEGQRQASNVLHDAVHDHYRHLKLVDREGRVVAEAGGAASGEMSVTLPNQAGSLLYADEMLILVKSKVTDGKHQIGTLTALARLPLVDSMLRNPDAVGESSRLNLCIDAGEKLRCFPSRHEAGVTERPKRAQGGDVPMALATRGQTGVSASTFDTRGVHVLAAYRWAPELARFRRPTNGATVCRSAVPRARECGAFAVRAEHPNVVSDARGRQRPPDPHALRESSAHRHRQSA